MILWSSVKTEIGGGRKGVLEGKSTLTAENF